VACPQKAGAAALLLDSTGSASFNTGCLPMASNLTYTPFISTHVITPVYEGDSNFNSYTYPSSFTFIAVRSPAVMVTSVNAAATTVSSTDGSTSYTTPVTVTAGSSASATLTFASIMGYGIAGSNQELNNYTFPLSLSCDNLPPHATCTFTYPVPDTISTPPVSNGFDISGCNPNGTSPALPNPYQLTGRSCLPGTATVTINTNVAVGTTTSQNSQPAPFKTGALLAAGLLGLFFSRKMRRGWRMMTMGMVCLLFLGAALIGTTGCSTTNLNPEAVLTTPAGTYNVTITTQQVGTQVVTGSGAPHTITGSQLQDSIPFTLSVTVK
jgi:hypothetical protein